MKTALELQQWLQENEPLVNKAAELVAKYKCMLIATCPEPCPYMEHDEIYVPGTYLDKGYTTTYLLCSLCGRRKHLKTTSDGGYG